MQALKSSPGATRGSQEILVEIIPYLYLNIHLQLQKKAILVLQWHVEFTLIEGLLGSIQDPWKEALMKGILNQRSGCNRKYII